MAQLNRRKFTREQAEVFADYLKNSTLKETANHFNMSYDSMKNTLNRYKLRAATRSSKNSIKYQNSNFFENIDTDIKAYFLGFMFSDGYIAENAYNEYAGLTLQKSDKYILERLTQVLDAHCTLNEYKNSIKLTITNLKVVEQLKKLGIQRNKSLNDFNVPNIPEHLKSSFIRGYFDGDGCITIKSTGYSMVSICSNSEVFLKEVLNILKNNNIDGVVKNEQGSRKNPLYILSLYKFKDRISFRDFIYSNSEIHLIRKFNKFKVISR